MPGLLDYDEVSAITYEAGDIAVVLTPEQQSLAVQALALFNFPALWKNYDANSDAIDALVAGTEEALLEPVTIPSDTPLYHYTHWHISAINNVGNAPIPTILTTQVFNHYALQNPAAQNDEWYSQDFWLAPVTYVCDAYAIKASASGIVTMLMRNVATGAVLATITQDLYSAAVVSNFVYQIGFTLSATTKVRLEGKVASKNAASSGYRCTLTAVMVRS